MSSYQGFSDPENAVHPWTITQNPNIMDVWVFVKNSYQFVSCFFLFRQYNLAKNSRRNYSWVLLYHVFDLISPFYFARTSRFLICPLLYIILHWWARYERNVKKNAWNSPLFWSEQFFGKFYVIFGFFFSKTMAILPRGSVKIFWRMFGFFMSKTTN